jgi:flagellar assembly factor FliW
VFGGEYDVRVEQAEFKELSVSASSDSGAVATIVMSKTGSKVVR